MKSSLLNPHPHSGKAILLCLNVRCVCPYTPARRGKASLYLYRLTLPRKGGGNKKSPSPLRGEGGDGGVMFKEHQELILVRSFYKAVNKE